MSTPSPRIPADKIFEKIRIGRRGKEFTRIYRLKLRSRSMNDQAERPTICVNLLSSYLSIRQPAEAGHALIWDGSRNYSNRSTFMRNLL